MLTAKFDPQSFFQRTENVALHVPAAEVFSLLKRAIDLPPQWGALVTREAGDYAAIAAGGMIEAGDVEDVLFVRLAPVELKFHAEGLASQDGFTFTADARVRVELLPDKTELSGFLHGVVGNRRVIQVESLAAKFQPVVAGALAAFASEREAAKLIDAAQWPIAGQAVAAALQSAFFSAGLSAEGAPAVALESAMFRSVQKTREEVALRQAQHEASQQLSQALATARAEHLNQLADSLARLKQMAADSPGVELPQLIRTFAEHQRGQLYESLFATDVPLEKTRWIVAVTSDELLFFDAQGPGEPKRRMVISGAAEKARSVKVADEKTLLIGAGRGAYAWPIDQAAPSRTYVTEKVFSRGGFNSVVRCGNILAGTHSEIGIWEWDWETTHSRGCRFLDLTESAETVRGLCVFEEDWYCSVDDRVIRWRSQTPDTHPDTTYIGAASAITAILPVVDGLYAGTSEGDLLFWPAGATENPDVVQRGQNRAIESIWLQQLHGVRRLVYPDTSPRIHARVLGDSFTFHYEAGGQTLRRARVAPDLIVATNELRDRLFCWTPSKPDHPSCVIAVGALSGRNVQDFCLVPAPASA